MLTQYFGYLRRNLAILWRCEGTWTVLFTPAEILGKNTAAHLFRRFVGTCKPAGGGAFNVVNAEMVKAFILSPE